MEGTLVAERAARMSAGTLPSLIRRSNVRGQRIEVEFHPSLSPRFVTSPFWAEYPDDLDLEALPTSLLVLPAVLSVAPAVWLSGRRYAVSGLESDTAIMLQQLKDAIAAMHPTVAWNGEIVPIDVAPESKSLERLGGGLDPADVGILFSGGLDSVATSLRNSDRSQLLVAVWGADVALADERRWSAVLAGVRSFAETYGHRVAPVKANLRDFVNEDFLNNAHADIHNWWGYVQHGMSLTGLALPLAAAAEADELLIASTHTEDFQAPWGSHPTIDDHVRWGPVSVRHDAFELSRQEKLRYCAGMVRETSLPTPALRVCYSSKSRFGENCCSCEKCYRTMTGLLVLGENPADWGFDIAPDDAARRIAAFLEAPSTRFDDNQLYMWQDIQNAARSSVGDDRAGDNVAMGSVSDLVRGLESSDLARLRSKDVPRRGGLPRARRFVKRRLPGLVHLVRKGQAALRFVTEKAGLRRR